MNNIRTIAKQIVIDLFSENPGYFDFSWDFFYSNYEKFFLHKIEPSQLRTTLSITGDETKPSIIAILLFIDAEKNISVINNDNQDLINALLNAGKKFNAQQDLMENVINKLDGIFSVNKTKMSNSDSPYHSPYKITITQNRGKKGTLIIHTNKGNSKILLTELQLQFLQALGKKSKDDSLLSCDKQGWLSYQEIMNKISAWNNIRDTYPIKLQVSSIREKLRKAGFSTLLIETLDGFGYRIGTFPDNISLD